VFQFKNNLMEQSFGYIKSWVQCEIEDTVCAHGEVLKLGFVSGTNNTGVEDSCSSKTTMVSHETSDR
jgi:hypothetical protein